MDYQRDEELIKQLEAYKVVCENLIIENKELRRKVNESENQVTYA